MSRGATLSVMKYRPCGSGFQCNSAFYEPINMGLTPLKILHIINSSGVQTTLPKTGLPPDIVQKLLITQVTRVQTINEGETP
jgi:hypothetical protein